jgi:hypothetical protein
MLVLLIVGCLLAGGFGAVHDQVSYSISPDYFDHLKFRQFAISPEYHNRLGAALVGWFASWWMGIFLAVPILLVGLRPDRRPYPVRCLKAFGVMLVTAIVVSLAAVVYVEWGVHYPLFWLRYPDGVTDQLNFTRVAILHDLSYTGGFLGIVTGSLYLLASRQRPESGS